jgi:hypothetical protein
VAEQFGLRVHAGNIAQTAPIGTQIV